MSIEMLMHCDVCDVKIEEGESKFVLHYQHWPSLASGVKLGDRVRKDICPTCMNDKLLPIIGVGDDDA